MKSIIGWLSAALLLLCVLGSMPALAQNNAEFITQSIPNKVAPGQSYVATITLRNLGTTTWISTGANPYRLGSQNAPDNTTWGANRAELPHSVAPGEQVTVPINMVAPAAPGNYNVQWRMVREGVEWFGGPSANVVVNVVAGASAGYANSYSSRTSAFAYDADGLLVREVIEPGDSRLCLVSVYTYDTQGNRNGATTRNCNGSTINSEGRRLECPGCTGIPAGYGRVRPAQAV